MRVQDFFCTWYAILPYTNCPLVMTYKTNQVSDFGGMRSILTAIPNGMALESPGLGNRWNSLHAILNRSEYGRHGGVGWFISWEKHHNYAALVKVSIKRKRCHCLVKVSFWYCCMNAFIRTFGGRYFAFHAFQLPESVRWFLVQLEICESSKMRIQGYSIDFIHHIFLPYIFSYRRKICCHSLLQWTCEEINYH